MTSPNKSKAPGAAGFLLALLRWLVGGYFVVAGLTKALEPLEFLQQVRQYEVGDHLVVLNAVAAVLPWLEVFCGGLLVVGVGVRGTLALLIGLLVVFTGLVVRRAWTLHAGEGIPFCAVRFDCGCGTGERYVCGKIAENLGLLFLCGALLRLSTDRGCARFSLIGRRRVRATD